MRSLKSIDGFWYLPTHDHQKIPGILDRYESGELRLRLFGWLFPEEPTGRLYQAPDIILGDTQDGQDITLVDCFACSGPMRRVRNGRTEVLGSIFGATHVHFGVHVTSKEKIKARCIELGFSKASAWKAPAPFRKMTRKAMRKMLRPTWSLEIRRPKNLILYRGKTLDVVYTEKIRSANEDQPSFSGLRPFLELRSSRKQSLDEFRQIVVSLEAYLSFISRTRINRTSLRYAHGPRNLLSPWVNLQGVWARSARNELGQGLAKDRSHDGFFTLRQSHERYCSSLAVWLDNYQIFFPVYVLFMSSLSQDATVDDSLFAMVQASEAFYQRTIGGKAKLNDIVASMANSSHPVVVRSIGDTAKFGETIRQIRNYYAHYDQRKGTYPYSGTELIDALNKIRLVFEVSILRWMKLSQDDIEECMRRVWAYSHLL